MPRPYRSGNKGHRFTTDGATYPNKINKAGFVRGTTVTSLVDTTAVTYTAAQVIGGIIKHDPTGGASTDTFPTAALLVAALPDCQIGDTIYCKVINTADNAETITLAEGAGQTFVGYTSLPQNASAEIAIRITGVTTPAYVIYR